MLRPHLNEYLSMADLLHQVAVHRDVDAFRQLFQSYAPRVKSYMMRQGADPNTAEELAQETLLTVWRKAALYSGEKGSATTWIFTIARNLRIDRLRREFPWQELPEGHNETASNDILPDEAVSEAERRTRVQGALATLPAGDPLVARWGPLQPPDAGRRAPEAWASAWRGWLANLGWPGARPLGSGEWQARDAWWRLHSGLWSGASGRAWRVRRESRPEPIGRSAPCCARN